MILFLDVVAPAIRESSSIRLSWILRDRKTPAAASYSTSNQIERPLGNFGGCGGHGCDVVSDVARLIHGKHALVVTDGQDAVRSRRVFAGGHAASRPAALQRRRHQSKRCAHARAANAGSAPSACPARQVIGILARGRRFSCAHRSSPWACRRVRTWRSCAHG